MSRPYISERWQQAGLEQGAEDFSDVLYRATQAEAKIEAALAEIKTSRAVGDHYLEGIVARIEKALTGGRE